MFNEICLLRFLHPKLLKHQFNCHLIEDRDDIDEGELISRFSRITQKLIDTVKMLRVSLAKLNDTTAAAMDVFLENISSLTQTRIRKIISYLKKAGQYEWDAISGNITYRIPYILSRKEQERLFYDAMMINYTMAGIDPGFLRDRVERCLASHDNPDLSCFPDEEDEQLRDEAMGQQLRTRLDNGQRCTMIVGAAHLDKYRRSMVLNHLKNVGSLLVLRPSYYTNEIQQDILRKEKEYYSSRNMHLFLYNIQTPEEAKAVADKVEKIIDDSYEINGPVNRPIF